MTGEHLLHQVVVALLVLSPFVEHLVQIRAVVIKSAARYAGAILRMAHRVLDAEHVRVERKLEIPGGVREVAQAVHDRPDQTAQQRRVAVHEEVAVEVRDQAVDRQQTRCDQTRVHLVEFASTNVHEHLED